MDGRNHQTIRHGTGLRSSAPQMGRRTYFRMAWWLSQADKGFRSDNRQRRCLGVRCAHANQHAATRNSLQIKCNHYSRDIADGPEKLFFDPIPLCRVIAVLPSRLTCAIWTLSLRRGVSLQEFKARARISAPRILLQKIDLVRIGARCGRLQRSFSVRYDIVVSLVLDRSPTTASIRLLSSHQRVWIEIG
jgi:hypothetical protein